MILLPLLIILAIFYAFGTIMTFGHGRIDQEFANTTEQARVGAAKVRYCYLWPMFLVRYLREAFTSADATLRGGR